MQKQIFAEYKIRRTTSTVVITYILYDSNMENLFNFFFKYKGLHSVYCGPNISLHFYTSNSIALSLLIFSTQVFCLRLLKLSYEKNLN